MWVWRDETVRGGWRLDDTGSWRYDEPARLESVGAPGRRERPEADARVREQWARERFLADQRARRERLRPALASTPGDPFEAEPIFRSVAHEVREERRYEDGRYRHAPSDRGARIPEPHPGSGPFPAQDGGRRRLAPVDEVPPPGVGDFDPAVSPEEEMRRRAERRRRPQAEPAGGRHVLRR
ncbi:hypothetical protein [Actinomycetospora termitidis]|uniref:Uncharacterized protein n=1 Tax=Actinomycetospora termitidis TaxID=3053470 RepID=A0ABT7M2K8_9PSEU|nr:hypothetical protein [Actinomycetospora sp. Odt1-22]MDL5154898.1 hypothetical protein [Actinomycetospora sp. Odt1-22]